MAGGFALTRTKIQRFLNDMLEQNTFFQFKRYLITGLLSFAFEYLLLITLTEYLKLWYLISNTAAFAASFIINFAVNRCWSFKSKRNVTRQLLLYIILLIFNLIVSNILMYAITDIMGVMYLISKIFVSGIITIWNFVIYKMYVYK